MKFFKEKVLSTKNKTQGITLIALVITIIVLLILAGVTIATLTGDNGILTRAIEAKFKTEISNLKEQIEIKEVSNSKENAFGTINGILGMESEYNDKLVIENGNLVYDTEKFSDQEKKWLEDLDILPKGNYYLIMMENTKTKFSGQTNIGTMQEFSELVNSGNFSYDIAYIIEDINLECDESNQWVTIGNENTAFSAVIEGNDYTISGLYIDNTNSYQGLFGNNTGTIKNIKMNDLYIKSDVGTGRSTTGGIVGYNNGGTIENCQIANSTIIASGNNVGGIVGWNENGGTVRKCTSSAKITNTGTYSTGGIVGWNNNNGQVYDCSNSGDITGSANVGGIVGTSQANSIIENTYNTGNIFTNGIDAGIEEILGVDCQILESRAGGICGLSQQSYINKSYNLGQIEGKGIDIGGICGRVISFIQEKNVSIENCYNSGKVIGTGNLIVSGSNNIFGGSALGGISGRVIEEAMVKTCYNTGDIDGVYTIGGIAGEMGSIKDNNSGNIENCYNIGDTRTKSTTKGGILGRINLGNIKSCYYLNITENGIGTGTDIDKFESELQAKTESEMKSSDFINLLNADYSEDLWKRDTSNVNKGYPIFIWQ